MAVATVVAVVVAPLPVTERQIAKKLVANESFAKAYALSASLLQLDFDIFATGLFEKADEGVLLLNNMEIVFVNGALHIKDIHAMDELGAPLTVHPSEHNPTPFTVLLYVTPDD